MFRKCLCNKSNAERQEIEWSGLCARGCYKAAISLEESLTPEILKIHATASLCPMLSVAENGSSLSRQSSKLRKLSLNSQ
jgi:hypothetical protein